MANTIMFFAAFLLFSVVTGKTLWHQLHDYSFEHYEQEFSKIYTDSIERNTRKEIFELRLKDIKIHNADNSKTWKEGVNVFTDRTAEEVNFIQYTYTHIHIHTCAI